MFKDTQKRINEYKAMLPDVKGRIVAAALALLMAVAMFASTTYAWLTISRAPEAKGMSTTLSGNGNLEISLVPLDGSLPGNATGAENSLLASNVTWGNLVNLSDASYGLDLIELRPALLSQYNLHTTPLYGATYGEDGRVSGSSDKYRFASYAVAEDGTKYFLATDAENPRYGVRAITSITYSNVTANAALNALQAKITNGYGTATQKYKNLIGTGDGSDSAIIYGEGSTAVRAIPALQMIMELYVQEQAQNVLGSYTQNYSGVVTYAYYLMDTFLDVLEAEGEALTSLANMQIYKTDNSLGTSYYQNFAALYTAYKTNKMHSAVKLESLKTFISNYDSISGALANDPNKDRDLYDLAMACDPNTVAASKRPTVAWSELSPYVAKLVDIGTVTIEHGSDKVTIGSLGGSSISPLLGLAGKAKENSPATATITKGSLKETEARLGAWLRESGLVISVNVNYMGVGEVYAYVVTNVDPQAMTLSGKDQETVENMTNAGADDQGEAVANDTYGMVIDLWTRTNVSDVVMTLEGSLVTKEVIATGVDKNGEEITLYVMSITTTETSTVYGITSDGVTTYYTYNAETDTMSRIGDSESMMSILGYEFTKTGSTKTVGEATYTEYTMKQKVTTNTDVYVIENVERWYTTDGTLVGAVKTLENDSRYAFTATSKTVTVGGQKLTVYTMKYTDSSTNGTATSEVYKVAEDLWHKAENHEELGTDAQLREDGATFTEKMEDVVIGYDGVNRIWKDYLALIESGFMLENNTTQGAGSCYVFYADPSEQNRILHLLEAFTVVFIDDAGNKLGTAKLDTEHYYSINGKTTVPLKLIAGTTFLDENGNQKYGITSLQKNEATRVSAIIYLDGTRLTNADVLAVGEIEGTLNLQFGSSVPLNNQDDTDLRFQFRDLEAVVTYNGQTSASSGQPISLEYNKDGHEVTVTLTVDGTQPKTIQGFFIRSISKSQGTKGQTVNFMPQDGDTWTATFKLTAPGTYIMRSLIVDGAEYALDDGTKDAENGVVTDSFPTVKIAGLGIASVHVEGLNRGITMTADHSVTAEVTVGINADASLMPKQVRALFRDPKTGREFTALLSNTGTGNSLGASVWKGTANITESGEYVLQYVYIDGVPFDLAEIWSDQAEEDPTKGQFTYIIYLGLTTKVWATGKTEFDFTGPTNVGFQLRIYDGKGNALNALDDVWLYYHSEGSVLDQDGMYAQVRWDSSSKYYVGTLPLNSGGNFLFNRVVTNRSNDSSRSTITRASSAPMITAFVKDPPEYVKNWTDDYQFVPNGGATMTVQLENARTADVWALITNGTDIYMVPKAALESTDGVDKYIFNIPADSTQDGQWEMLALYMWRCANSEGDWISAGEAPVTNGFIKLNKAEGATVWTVVGTDATVDPADFFVLDTTDKDVEAYVVQTVYASVNGAASMPLDEIKFGDVGFGFEDTNKNGRFDSGETVTSSFMDSHNTEAVTFVITDWNGNALDDSLTVSVAWTSKYDKSYSNAYGGYTTEHLYQDVQVNLTQTANTYTLAAQTYQLAGKHTTQFTVKVDGTTIATIMGDTVSVRSKTPTATISAISPTGSNPTKVTYNATYKYGFFTGITFYASEPETSSKTDTSATLYAVATADNSTQKHGSFTRPTLTLTIAGVTSDSKVELVLPAGAASAITFSRTGNGTIKQTLGNVAVINSWDQKLFGIGVTHTLSAYYGHGQQTITKMKVTYNTVDYEVTLTTPISINNPSSVNQ